MNAGFVAAIFTGSGPVLLENPIYIFLFFRGGGGPDPLPPSESAHGLCLKETTEGAFWIIACTN